MANAVWFMRRCVFGIFMFTLMSVTYVQSLCSRQNITGALSGERIRFPNRFTDGSDFMKCVSKCLATRLCEYIVFELGRCRRSIKDYGYPMTIFPQRLMYFHARKSRSKIRTTGKTQPRRYFHTRKYRTKNRTTGKTQTPTTSKVVTSDTTLTATISNPAPRSPQQPTIKQLKRNCKSRGRFSLHQVGQDSICLALKNGVTEKFPDAKKKCTRIKGRLVVANTEVKMNLLKTFLQAEEGRNMIQTVSQAGYRAWIGLQGNTWVDGSPRTVVNFQEGAKITNSKGWCVSIKKTGNCSWKYEPCSTTYNYYICEKI